MFLVFHDRVRLKPATLLLGLCYAGSAIGLGLGEVQVRSYLGQPLHATIHILDADPALSASCFSLKSGESVIAPPLRAQLSLEQTGGKTLLHLRTPQAIYDPIAQFVLTSECEARLQREYVILLDPPSQAEPIAPPVATTPAAVAPVPRASSPTPAPRPAAQRTQVAADAAPRLVLSGRRMARDGDTPFALKLDTNLPDMNRVRTDGLSAVEMSDENTALTRKLAHLETQLIELQQRNAELEARRAAVATAAPPPVKPPTWPMYLLLTGLLLVAGALVIWLRRRGQQSRLEQESVWHPLSMEPEADLIPTALKPVMPAKQAEPAPVRMPEIAQPTLEKTTEVKDDILDQAEVYMAHGHSDLAIHLLQEHLREAPTESPIPWLLLLDLLHREGDTAGYAATCAECRTHFNINLSDHPEALQNELDAGLEAYPHLLDRLTEVWRSPDIDAFFTDLIFDHRGGTRIGFAPAAFRDILLLRAIAQDTLAHAA